MKSKITIEYFGRVKDIEFREDLIFIEDYNTDTIKEYFGNNKEVNKFDCFFVSIIDGEYGDIFGMYNTIPYLNKDLYKIDLKIL